MYEILIFHGAGLIKSRNERKEGKKVKWIIGIKGMGIKKKRSVEAREKEWNRNGERIEKVEIKRLFNL